MFRTKICGVTRLEDARDAVAAGVEAIGLNFFPQSKRFVTTEKAAELTAAIGREALRVGVFVNSSPNEIRAVAETAQIDAVQLHGDEKPSIVSELPEDLPIIRAHRCDAAGLAPLAEWLQASRAAGRPVAAALVDAPAPAGQFGGTGHKADWNVVFEQRHLLGETPLILAGGLTPANVAEAIQRVRPYGVDTASGVESAPGTKDLGLVQAFLASAKASFAGL